MRTSAIAGMMVTALVIVSCAVPVESESRPLDIDVDADILDSGRGVEVGDAGEVVEIHLVTDGHLVAVNRRAPEADADSLVAVLLDGATAAEEELAIRSAIPPGTGLLGVERIASVVTVDLTDEFTIVGGQEEILAVAQIVVTLDALAGVDGVRFSIGGTPIEAPVGEGQLVDRPLVATDFREQLIR